jgi:hypothetical protein
MRQAAASVRNPGQAPRDGSGGAVRGVRRSARRHRPSGEAATLGGHRPHHTSAGPKPSCSGRPRTGQLLRLPDTMAGSVCRSAAAAEAARVRTPSSDAARIADTRCPQRGQWTGRSPPVQRQRTWPSRLRQKGHSSSAQAAVMASVARHMTTARHTLPGHPRPPAGRRGRTQHRAPEAADGQSAGRSVQVTSTVTVLRAASGRPPARRRRGGHRASRLTPASKLLECHQGVARHPYRRMLGALTERGISSIAAAHPGGVCSMRKAATFVGLALGL